MTMFYSAKYNGFFPSELKSDYENSDRGWPDDAIAIAQSDYEQLMSGRNQGKIITADRAGNPVLSDPPVPTQEELIREAEAYRDMLLAKATARIAPLQDAVDLDEATEDEKKQLTTWKKYRVLTNRTDISTAPHIKWPPEPQ